MREWYKYFQCGIKTTGMKTYYDDMLRDDNTTLGFPSFNNRDGVQKLVDTMLDDQALGVWEQHTLDCMRWNENHKYPIKYWSRDIIKSIRLLMRQSAFAKHCICALHHCFICGMPLKHIYTAMRTVDWWWEMQVRRYTPAQLCAKQHQVKPQRSGYTGSIDRHIRQNTSLELCWWQGSVACIYDNWQCIFEDPPDAHNAQHCNGHSPADSNQDLQYSSAAAWWAMAFNPRGAEQSTTAGTPSAHL